MSKQVRSFIAWFIAIGGPILILQTAQAATSTGGSATNIENFIRSVIQLLAGLAGLIATGFFVVGGFRYITSSGHPEHLERAKRTILYSALGLAITIGAFVLSNIVTTLASNAIGS